MFLALLGAAGAARAGEACGDATLSGSYIMSGLGTDGDGSALAGMIFYDGKGGYDIRLRFGGKGEVTAADKGAYRHVGGCEFEAVSQSGRSAHYFVDPSGERFKFVISSGGHVAGDAQRVSREKIGP